MSEGEIRYVNTKAAIVQRFVDLSVISFYETLGICFGRKPQKYEVKSKEITGKVERHM